MEDGLGVRRSSAAPDGADSVLAFSPPMNRWAIFRRPCGTWESVRGISLGEVTMVAALVFAKMTAIGRVAATERDCLRGGLRKWIRAARRRPNPQPGRPRYRE